VSPPTEKEQTLALLLQQNWFASLIGWSAGLHSQTAIIDHVRTALRLYLKGMDWNERETKLTAGRGQAR
jgi:hypothetical protein